ncbi:MAG TPA: MG2 domain-containing protein, partial [Planctomycetota bacterium]|nr:MG2 domain-containing protein [Planctomycetota bacterium]
MKTIVAKMANRRLLPLWVVFLTGALVWTLQTGVFAETPEELYQEAAKLYAAKDYTAAQTVLEKLHKDFPAQWTAEVSLKLADCYRHTIPQSGKTEEWETAEGVLKDLIARKETTDLERARAERLTANLKFEWPHWGYKTNAKFARGDNRGGGDYKDTFVEDREAALDAIRAARNDYEKELQTMALRKIEVVAGQLSPIEAEAIDMYFDLGRIAAWDNSNLYQAPPHAPADKNLPTEVVWQDTLSDKGMWTYATQRITALDRTTTHGHALQATYLQAMFLKRYYGLTAGAKVDKLKALPEAENPYKLLIDTYRKAPVAAALKTPAAQQEDLAAECLYAAGMVMQDLQDFNTAMEAFKTLIQERPQSKWRTQAESAIKAIEQPILNAAGGQGSQTLQDIDETGKLTPRKITFPLSVRNIKEVRFTAQPVDLAKAIAANGGNYYQLFNLYYNEDRRNKVETVIDYKIGEPLSFTCKVDDAGDHAVKTVSLEMPFDKPGAWVVEAQIDGAKVRQLMVATDLIVIYRLTDADPVIYVADAVTGKPATDAEVTFYEQWWQNRQMQKELASGKVTAEGTVALPAGAQQNGRNMMVSAVRRDPATKAITSIAFTQPTWMGRQNWNPGQQTKVFSITDRPVYRPGQTVKFKHTLREYNKEEYTNPGAGQRVHVTINDVKGAKLYDQVLTTNDFGTVFGEMKLSETAALGQYWIQVYQDNARWGTQVNGGNTFRVEEYKKPEYEVSVKSDVEQARIGGKVHATVTAKYYYGAPVTQATVQYKVQRKRYNYTWSPGGEWSWLYGRYYGCCWYWPYWWYQQPV